MLGCSAEKAILLLIGAYTNAMKDATKRKDFENQLKNKQIGKKYELFGKKFWPSVSLLPPRLADDLHGDLDRVFDLIRRVRNDAGHPTGKPVTKEIVHANYLSFPQFCGRVYDLMDYFQANPI